METGAIIGIVLGAVALALIIGFLCYMYWWAPHHNRTTHHEGKLDLEFDEKTRKRLMEKYDDMPDDEGLVTMNEGLVGEYNFQDLP